ncbi:MAG: ribonuclease R [Pseudomonadota bacterium]|nr:ribonuclease R [Pseudomonadota bacterium]
MPKKQNEPQERYEKPIPDRNDILNWVEKKKRPVTFAELVSGLEVLDDEDRTDGMIRRLRAMVRDGQLIKNNAGKFGLPDKMDLIKGRVIGHRDGFGFIAREDGQGDDLFLSPRQMRKVLDGDIVLVRIMGIDHRGREEASVIQVLKRKRTTLVGKVIVDGGVTFFEPDNTRVAQEFVLLPDADYEPSRNDMVEVEIVQPPSGRFHGQVKLVQVLGDIDEPGMEVQAAIRSHSLPHEFSQKTADYVKTLSDEVLDKDKQGRVDLRDLPLVTIDGEDARDFDDAVYCEPRPRGAYRLVVAIADVSHYVPMGSALDADAYERATSVYFPDQVIPMLPEKLSNGLCSLNPKVDRLCMVCDMQISAKGNISKYQFYEAVMNSKARLTYNKVSQLLEQPESAEAQAVRQEIGSELEGHLISLYSLYHVLLGSRKERGAIDFETVETQVLFDDQRKIEAIVPRHRNDAHKIIEECMLCANVATAKFLNKYKLPGLYRNHAGPTEEKLEQLGSYLQTLGLSLHSLNGKGKVTPADYQAILEQVKDRPDADVIQIRLLRSMSQAVYQPKLEGHFGLNYTSYTHFTSPIRRYPDLLNHRAIRYAIHANLAEKNTQVVEQKPLEAADWIIEDTGALLQVGEHCSMAERRADEATREVMDKLKCQFMQQHLGDEFTGVVTSVTGFGLFIELEGIYIEGLVHISSLKSDYYHFDPVQQTLEGERSKTVYGIGQSVQVMVAGVSMDDRKIDLELVGSDAPKDTSSKTRSKRKNSKRDQLKSGEATRSDNRNAGAKSSAKPGTKSGSRTGSKKSRNSRSKKRR